MLSSPLKLPQNQQVEDKSRLDNPVAKRSNKRQTGKDDGFQRALADSQKQQLADKRRQQDRALATRQENEVRAQRRLEDRQQAIRAAEERSAKASDKTASQTRAERPADTKEPAQARGKDTTNSNDRAESSAPSKELQSSTRQSDANAKNTETARTDKGHGESATTKANEEDKEQGIAQAENKAKAAGEDEKPEETTQSWQVKQALESAKISDDSEATSDNLENSNPSTKVDEKAENASLASQTVSANLSELTESENDLGKVTDALLDADKLANSSERLSDAATQKLSDETLELGLPSDKANADPDTEQDATSISDELVANVDVKSSLDADVVELTEPATDTQQKVRAEYEDKAKTDWLDNLIKIVNFAYPDKSADKVQGEAEVSSEMEKGVSKAMPDSELLAQMKAMSSDIDKSAEMNTEGEALDDAVPSAMTKIENQQAANSDATLQALVLGQPHDETAMSAGKTTSEPVELAPTNIPSHIMLKMRQGANSNQAMNGTVVAAEAVSGKVDPTKLSNDMANAMMTEEAIKVDKDTLASTDLRQLVNGQLSNPLSSTGTESGAKLSQVEVQGVQLDRHLAAPKLEQMSQVKHEAMIKESVLFNKQELAANVQQQVGLMMARNLKSVDIRLDPPELGSMQIKLSVSNEQAAVSFVVSSQQAKDALEGSLPRLRELLEQQGMELADSDVKQENGQAGNEGAESGPSGDEFGAEQASNEQDAQMAETSQHKVNSPWSVDYYA